MISVVFQALFGVVFVNCLLLIWTLCKLIHFLPGFGSKQKRYQYSIAVSSFCFRYIMLKPCPWLRIHGLEQVEENWNEMAKSGAPFLLANHNSKLDSLLITALLPLWLGPKMRSLIKKDLFSEPLFGAICTAVGHFPVFFKSTAEGAFGVDKEAQAQVAADMDAFLKDDGGLLIFPEGQLNKTPRKVQLLRRGSFTLPITHKKPVWGFVNVGCEKAWPYKEIMGGVPSDIYIRTFKVTDDASKFDTATLAEHAGKVMQEQIDQLYAMADAHSKTD